MNELLTPAEMAAADRLAAEDGGSFRLMRNAGAAVAAEALRLYPAVRRIHVLCGPGNNGGDGYVAAAILAGSGCDVRLWRAAPPKAGTDAGRAAAECPLEALPLRAFQPTAADLVIDALYGAGLSKPLGGEEAEAIARLNQAGSDVLAVDLPSGLDGTSGRPTGQMVKASATVTFFRKKPGHLLQPGRALCGTVIVRDIGIPAGIAGRLGCRTWENGPSLWSGRLPIPSVGTHKYARGHVGVFSGGPASTGAARLAAMAAARAGAGAVTVLSPASAILVNAAHLTAIMVRRIDNAADLRAFRQARPGGAFVIGPGFGSGEHARAMTLALLNSGEAPADGVVLDADVITAFSAAPEPLYEAAGAKAAPPVVLTPHEGEFRRLFGDIAADEHLSKLDRARAAARRSNAVVIYKGPDTVIAAPDGRAAINANGSPWLATAGSGDVLCGVVAGSLSQKMPAFEAACAAVWIHAEAGSRFGPGLTADDLPGALLPVLRELYDGNPN